VGGRDYELEFLLSLSGQEFRFASGYSIKVKPVRAAPTSGRPHGIKYSLTLHDPRGRRIYGLDNSHRVARQREFDHRHVYGARRAVGYRFRGPAELLEDFYKEVTRILAEKGGMR